MSLTALAVTGGTAAFGCLMWHWRGQNPPIDRAITHEQIVGGSPEALRTAVFVLSSPAQRNVMFESLGLGSKKDGYPWMESYDYTPAGLEIDVQMSGGQALSQWTTDYITDAMAHYLAVPDVSVTSPEPGWVRISAKVLDVLAAPMRLPVVNAQAVDLEFVPVGLTEDFDVWYLRVRGTHILVAGATGSGKGSILWSMIDGLGPAIRDGYVALWVIDPKGGMELGPGEALYHRFECDDPEDMLDMLQDAVDLMDERMRKLRKERRRKHIPTPESPQIVIIIDEAAALSAYVDGRTKAEFERLTALLMSKGRAPGVTIVIALQDPSKRVLELRQLLSTRVGLRMDEPNQTVMVHGKTAPDKGANCDAISEATPGVAYVGEDGSAEFIRVRAFLVEDEDIDRIVDQYTPRDKRKQIQ